MVILSVPVESDKKILNMDFFPVPFMEVRVIFPFATAYSPSLFSSAMGVIRLRS